MKKKLIILTSIIIVLILTTILILNNKVKTIEGEILVVGSDYLLVATKDNKDYVIKTNDTNYEVGDKITIETKNINKKNTPYEAKSKNISIIEKKKNNTETKDDISNSSNNDKQDESKKENNTTTKEEIDNEKNIINYFEDLKIKIQNYNQEHDISKEIKEKFVTCIDFLFYDKPIDGKTFKELSNEAKLKVLEIAMYIDSKIDNIIPGYKDSISASYQNIKYKVVELYLNTTTDICNNDKELCNNAKEGFSKLKENFGITWNIIKSLAGTGISKLKNWYEIWRYN